MLSPSTTAARLMRAGTPSDIREAVLALVEAVASGRRLNPVVRSELAALSAEPEPVVLDASALEVLS